MTKPKVTIYARYSTDKQDRLNNLAGWRVSRAFGGG